MKKIKNNIEILTEAATNLGLQTELIQTSVHKTSLLVTGKDRFYLASAGKPGFYPKALRWNTQFSSSKLLTQKILKRLGYNVIVSAEVRVALHPSIRALNAYLESMDITYPVLVKPDHGLRGQGISVANTLPQLKKQALQNFKKEKDFMVQPIVAENEYRILVINGEVMLMHSKQNPSIEGDGVSTIADLLAVIPESKKDPVFISFQHVRHGTKPSTVLKKGEMFEYHLTKKPTATFYETKNIPAVSKKWALKLAKEIHASVVGIDVFIPAGFSDVSTYTIIELNSNPGIDYLASYCDDPETGVHIFEKVLKDYFEIKS